MSEQRGREEGINQRVGSECQAGAPSPGQTWPRSLSRGPALKLRGQCRGGALDHLQRGPDKSPLSQGVWGVHLLVGE